MSQPRVTALLTDRWLLGQMAVGLVVRVVLAVWLDDSMAARGDEGIYRRGALLLRESGTFDTGTPLHPPLYFVFLASTSWLSGLWPISWTLTTKLLQCLLSVATAIPVYRTARRISGVRAARFAAAFLLFDPTLIAFTHMLWPATVFLLLLAIVCDALPGLETRSNLNVATHGLLFGLAMLLKSAVGVLALFFAGWWARRLGLRTTLRLVLVFGGTALLVVAPWAVRNQLRYGSEILLENELPYNLWIGNDPQPAQEILRTWVYLGDPVTRSHVGMRRGLLAIGEDPQRFARRFVERAVQLWGLEFFVVRHLVTGGYGQMDRGAFLLAYWAIQGFWALALLAAALGLARGWRDPVLRLVLMYALVFTLIVSGMVATTRFRIPFGYVLAVCAGLGVDRLLVARDRRGWVPAFIALAVLASSASRPIFWTISTGSFEQVSELNDDEWRFFRY